MFGAVHMWVYIYNIFVINKGTDTSKKPKTTGSWAKTNLREGGGEAYNKTRIFIFIFFLTKKYEVDYSIEENFGKYCTHLSYSPLPSVLV